MQNVPSQVTAGNIAPAISGPAKDRDVLVVSGLVVSLAAVIGAVWYYSSTESTPTQGHLNGSQVSEVLKDHQPVAMPISSTIQEIPMTKTTPGIMHTDLYFEVGRRGLTDEASKLLQDQALILKNDPNLGVLVQGHTDQQGSESYNMQLGLKRAEAVKTAFLHAGVAEHQIKVVSLGESGALCVDNSDVCRRMNRRVHLEIRAIGREHMVPSPPIATKMTPDSLQLSADPSHLTDKQEPSGSIVPTADPGSESTPEEPLQSASGS
jgi:peptidoglycan-associated lipoprotein